ncbi:MAG: TIGR04219 family outer membrane beta-barrel protein [Psychrobium sp.]
MTFKKLALASALVTAFALPAKADVLGVYVGAQGWQNEANGGFSQNANLVDFAFEEKTNTNLYLKFEHPVPLVPNARIRVGKLETNGSAELNSAFTFGGKTYRVNENVDTTLDFTNNDATLYWELLDNDIVAFDFGLTAKNIKGDFLVEDGTQSSMEEVSVWLPMGYAAAKVRIPFAGLYVYGDANFVSYDGSKVHDYEVGLGYDLIDNIAVDVALTAGYREVVIELDDVDDINADLEFSGFFAGLEVHF